MDTAAQTMQARLAALRQQLEAYGQAHLLACYEALEPAQQAQLLSQLEEIDYAQMQALYGKARAEAERGAERHFTRIEPMPCLDSTAMTADAKRALYRTGLAHIRSGELAVLTLAGGQGTRLGHNGPKGTYDIGLPSHRSLFAIQCEGLKKVWARSGFASPWYIMTSTVNHDETVAFFEKNGYFGYPREQVHFFTQTMIPAMTRDGQMQLESPDRVLRSPNGNGGMFVSLEKSGCFADMEARGARYLFVCGIDNCLVQMADPLFLGAFLEKGEGAQASAKSYIKRGPEEKAGIFCYRDGKPGVLEYTEIPPEYASMRAPSGEWMYGDTNVLNYIFPLDVARRLATAATAYHVAVKKLTYYDPHKAESVTVPDGFKFELFLFDAFLHLDRLQVLRVARTEEFAPVKNAVGVDSAESARRMYLENERTQPRKWEEEL